MEKFCLSRFPAKEKFLDKILIWTSPDQEVDISETVVYSDPVKEGSLLAKSTFEIILINKY